MKPAPYALLKDTSLQDVQTSIADDEMHKIVAGGQSLGAMLNLRLVRVDALHDLNAFAQLKQMSVNSQQLMIGAMVTHAELEDQGGTDPVSKLLSQVASGIAYRAVRNSGTIGGSLCHADPAADWVSAIALLDAELTLEGHEARRCVPADTFMRFPFETELQAGEILTQIRIQQRPEGMRWSYRKHCRKTGEFALAIVGAIVVPETGEFRLVFGALDGPPIVLTGDSLAQQMNSDAGLDDLVSKLTEHTSPGQIALYKDLLRQVALDIGVS